MTQPQALKFSRREQGQRCRRSWAILPSLLLLLFALPADAAEGKKNHQKVRYDVYAGGIHALQADLIIDLTKKDSYNLALSAKTYGLLGSLAPWSGIFETKGWRLKNKNQPELHQSSATWRDELEVKKYAYKKDGSFDYFSIKDDENDGSPKPVDDELTQGTSDILSATLHTMQAIAADNKCEGTSEVFDGERRYKMIFKHKQDVTLEANRWNVYSGPAVECSIEVQPVAGKWHKKPRGWLSIQEQGRERGTMPTIWFATMEAGNPAVPIKVRVKTSYGTLFMHMTEYDGLDKKLVLED